ncbi:response regulator transcription factor [Octadecabacter sp. G9-8]|uniref:Response regulator transcription factor n=1 Tax=Octadecabacter dasysiphoniae TaxID=2909341 RepID=A0ABS9CT41_9RHOB|nr:response regulator transcription factor [Octadecabacter dasysiphoniae]MCF2870395.1 response regulator transcription factor [Octadecabacter dasysiphoniae]
MKDRTILVVEDDQKIRNLLRNVFEDEGARVIEAQTGAEVMRVIADRPVSLVTLDLHLGADNGIDIARQIRTVSQVPIIMVTGKDDVIDRVVGLEVGADDYITKPFHVREVIARVRSVLRRSCPLTSTIQTQAAKGDAHFRFDGMTAFPDRLELIDRENAPCELTSGDFKLLNVFLKRPKRVLSRDQLMDLTGGVEWSPLDRSIDNQVARLRKKIERDPSNPRLIKTVRGIGYTFASDVKAIQPSAESVKSA